MKFLTLDQIIILHEKLIIQTGGSIGIRDKGLIESARLRAMATFDRVDLYKTNEEKIAIMTHSLINNHGFVDGNKRIGIAVMLMLAKMNQMALVYSQDELISLGLSIADSRFDEDMIVEWINKHKKDIQ